MPKRGGGLGYDKFPQWLKASALQTSAGTTTTTQIVIPGNVIGGAQKSVIEILEVKWDVYDDNAAAISIPVKAATQRIQLGLTTLKSGMSTTSDVAQGPSMLADPFVISSQRYHWQACDFTTSGEATAFCFETVTDWTQDASGNGIIVASPYLYLTIFTSGIASIKIGARVAILYRFRTASADEYISLIQAQQSGN